MKKYFGLLLALVLVLQSFAFVSADEGTETGWALTIMHTNDTHAHLENVAKRFTVVNEIRAEVQNSLLLDAGDVFSGTLFFNKYLGLADLDFMNRLGYDAMTFGNHEFDRKPEVLANFVKETNFPLVSANIDFTQDAHMKGFVQSGIGENAEGGKIYSSIILDVNGEKVGVIGLTTLETEYISSPGKDIKFNDYVKSAETAKAALEAKGINKIIVLSHLGYEEDLKLAKAVKGLDVIVGGHSHTKLDKPVVIDNGDPTFIVQANEWGKYLGRVDVTFDKNGVLMKAASDGKLIDINAKDADGKFLIADDEAAKALYEEYKAPLEEMLKEVVGFTTVPLEGDKSIVRTQETNLGNLIADAMLAKGNALTGATIAITNGGGIRASIAQGEISLGDVRTVQPFENTFVTLEMTGAQIWSSLENGVAKVEEEKGQFPQVAGMKFSFDPAKEAGKRVVSVEVKTDKGYAPISLTASYIVATNAFMADGGDGYTAMKEAKDAGKMNDLYFVDYEIFVEYLEANSPISPAVEGRITAVAAEQKQDDVYVVKSGDVLWKIASTYGYTYQDLAAYNNLKNPHLIIVGQKLLIPAK